MQQTLPKASFSCSIQDGGKDGGIQLILDGLQNLAVRLTTQQARTLACDLIRTVNRSDALKVRQQNNT